METDLAVNYHQIENPKTFEVTSLISAHYFPSFPRKTPYWEKYDFAQIFLLLSGSVTYVTETASYPVRPGCMVYRPPFHESQYNCTGEKTSYALISFSCRSEALHLLEGEPIPLFGEESATLLETMKTAARVCELISPTQCGIKPNVASPVLHYIYASLERFLCMLFCRLNNISLMPDESQKVNRYLEDTRLAAEVKEYIELHLSEECTVQEISTHFWVSPTSLMKKFKRETGTSLRAYLIYRRIEEAKKKISNTDCSFSEISESLGFSSVNYFSTLFREKTGMTPTEFSKLASKRRIEMPTSPDTVTADASEEKRR